MADKPISNAARKVAEKLIQTKYRSAGTYAVDKARGEGRSVVSAAQHARYSEKNAMRPTSAAEINRAQTNKIQKNSVRVVGTKQQMETAIKTERSKNINTDGAARARAMEAKLKASSNVKVINSNPVPTRTSGLSGVSGKLGGQHAGGHGASLGGMSGMDLGGGGSFSRENM